MDRKREPLPKPAARSTAWAVGLLVALCFTTLPLFLALSPGRPALFDVWQKIGVRVAVHYVDEPKHSGSPLPESRDILLGGLLSPDVDASACVSRYLSSTYRKPSPHSPSPYLVSRLRKYEALHRRCGPGTGFYDKSVRQLDSAHNSMGLAECRYLVWTPGNHLGDRMVSMAHDYQLPDQRFFCDGDQTVLGKVNWLLLRSDLYFAPGLFLVPQFEDELRWMFPATDTVFHHVGMYLFHPSNEVWKTIQGYYTSYMAKFHEKIGLQITNLAWNPVSTEAYFNQIAACTNQEKILPEIDREKASSGHEAAVTTSKAVLVSSAQSEYAEKLTSMYNDHATVTGEPVSVLQPPGAGKQPQNHKVLVEMFLQSYCDVSVVSGWSTVGYVGHGLAGVNPWLLLPPRNQTVAHPPCVRAMSMEPCFHAPPSYDCRAKKGSDLGAVLRYVRHCEDVDAGLKLFA